MSNVIVALIRDFYQVGSIEVFRLLNEIIASLRCLSTIRFFDVICTYEFTWVSSLTLLEQQQVVITP